jgi:CBS domain containing-hemolysin-like protein
MTGEFVLLFLLIMMSGFFSASETALFSISRTKARHLAKSPGRAYQLIVRMKQDSHKLLTTILIGNNVVNIGASSLATAITIQYFSKLHPGDSTGNAVGLATGVMTLLILIFGEIFPKSVAVQHNIQVAKIVIFPLYWLSYIFYPAAMLLNFIPKLSGNKRKAPAATEEELITFVDVVQEEGEINPNERELIYNVFKLDDVSVSEIMTPSVDMFIIDLAKPVDIKKIIESGFTRIPVIKGDIDHVVGIMHIKDLFRHQIGCDGPVDIEKIMREPYFVPEYKKLDQLLNQFKHKKEHAAIVVNEYGEVSGIVTMEDILEAIVGDIMDETDIDVPAVVKIREKEWLVLGSAEVQAINEKLKTQIPESDDYETFSGYVLEQIGRIPKEQEQIVIDNLDITVKEMEGNRIKSFIVRRK